MVYIHNAHLVIILHNCKYFNSMLFCSACCFWLNCRSDKRHRMSLWMHKRYHHKLFCGAFIGTGTYSAVYWSNFTFVFLKSRCTIYFSLSLGPPTHTHKTARTLILKSEIALWIFSLSPLPSFVCWNHSTVTDLAKFRGKSTWKENIDL